MSNDLQTNGAWGVDVSLWQDAGELTRAQCQIMKDNGCGFAVIRAGGSFYQDPELIRHIDNFYTVGIPIGLYLWGDLIYNPQEQVDWWASIADPYRSIVQCYCLDAEQWWTDWAKWRAYSRGEIPRSAVPKATPAQISERYRLMAVRMREVFERPSFIYTGGWFIRYEAPAMASWINAGNYPFWNAEYRYGPNNMPYAQLLPYLAGLGNPDNAGVNSWAVWQFTSGGANGVTLPGLPQRLDLNYIRNAAVYSQLFGASVPPPPPPPQTPVKAKGTVTAAAGLRVRSGPGTSYSIVDLLPVGTEVEVQDFGPTTWVQIGAGRWCCAKLSNAVYVEFDNLPDAPAEPETDAE